MNRYFLCKWLTKKEFITFQENSGFFFIFFFFFGGGGGGGHFLLP